MIGLFGLINEFYFPKPNHFDIIPVDIVSNSIVLATAFHGCEPNKDLSVYHTSSSSQNPITIEGYMEVGGNMVQYTIIHGKIFKPFKIKFSRNKMVYQVKAALREELPVQAMEVIGKVPHPALEPIR